MHGNPGLQQFQHSFDYDIHDLVLVLEVDRCDQVNAVSVIWTAIDTKLRLGKAASHEELELFDSFL